MYSFKSIISKINSWKDFKNALLPLSKLEKGNAFEELTRYFLLVNPTYNNKLKNVWLQKEVPVSVVKKLNLPSNDQGIDLIAETKDGYFGPSIITKPGGSTEKGRKRMIESDEPIP